MTSAEQDAGAKRKARQLFAGTCEFMLGVASLTQLPESAVPEVAMAGRSNVGKSSLINALTGHKALARTSNTPGRTQQLNFFNLGGGRLTLVDLPGYGYANVPKEMVDAWTELLRSYLAGRQQLRRVCVLVDARHGLKASDLEMMDMLDEAAVMYQIVLTKADKLKDKQRETRHKEVQAALKKRPAAHPEVILTSSVNKTGVADVQTALAAFALE